MHRKKLLALKRSTRIFSHQQTTTYRCKTTDALFFKTR